MGLDDTSKKPRAPFPLTFSRAGETVLTERGWSGISSLTLKKCIVRDSKKLNGVARVGGVSHAVLGEISALFEQTAYCRRSGAGELTVPSGRTRRCR